MKQRATTKELIDLGNDHYSPEEYCDALHKLDRIGRLLGGDRTTFSLLKDFPKPKTILEVGCGGGFFAIKLARRYPQAEVLGIDLNPDAIAYAKKHLASLPNPPPNLSFKACKMATGRRFDLITSTLVCHHIEEDLLGPFIGDLYEHANQGVVLNDLYRHPLAYFSFKLIAPLFFRNRLVLNDGPLSVRRSFRRADWIRYLSAAQIPSHHAHLYFMWAFRWGVLLKK